MIRYFAAPIAAIALLSATAGGAFAEEFDSRDIMGGGPNFFRGGSSPVPRTTVMYNGNYAPGTIVVNTSERRLYLVLQNGQAQLGVRGGLEHLHQACRRFAPWRAQRIIRAGIHRAGSNQGLENVLRPALNDACRLRGARLEQGGGGELARAVGCTLPYVELQQALRAVAWGSRANVGNL